MNDIEKTKEQLMVELSQIRQRVRELEQTCDDIAGNHQAAKKTLMEEHARAQMYLDIAEVILVAINEKGEIILINRKGCRILGYENEELVALK